MGAYQLFPITVMGEQPRPTSTSRPVRSRPRRPAMAETALSVEDRTLLQHWGDVGAPEEVGGTAEELAAGEEVGGTAEELAAGEEVGGTAEELAAGEELSAGEELGV
jgi:hypothetical protein